MPEPAPIRWRRRLLLGTAGWLAACSSVPGRIAAGAGSAEPLSALPPCPPAERRVGIGYALWHQDDQWQRGSHPSWGTPSEGFYRSDDPAVLTRHASQLAGAGIDFVVVDWSNDLGMDIRNAGGPATQRFIEQSTLRLFDVWAALPAAPKVALMIGNPGAPDAVRDGALAAKADEVQGAGGTPGAAADPSWQAAAAGLCEHAHALGHSLPPWRDARFTVRFVTGFVTQQRSLVGTAGISRYGYWSWEDRGTPTYAVFEGQPECMTVVAAWRGAGSRGRDGGRTYAAQLNEARRIGPRFVLAGTFNEWWASEQIDPLHSKDVEPSRELGAGSIDVLRRQSALFRQGL